MSNKSNSSNYKTLHMLFMLYKLVTPDNVSDANSISTSTCNRFCS